MCSLLTLPIKHLSEVHKKEWQLKSEKQLILMYSIDKQA